MVANHPLAYESTTYAREVRPSIAQPRLPHPNVPVTHPLTAQQMARTSIETRLTTAVPIVQAPEALVHREHEHEGHNDHSASGETSELEGSSFVSFFRSLWGGWGDNTGTQPPANQNSPSIRSVPTVGRSETAAAERTIKQYQRRNDPEEGYSCPLCWDKKTHLSCLRCGHVFCTSYALSHP